MGVGMVLGVRGREFQAEYIWVFRRIYHYRKGCQFLSSKTENMVVVDGVCTKLTSRVFIVTSHPDVFFILCMAFIIVGTTFDFTLSLLNCLQLTLALALHIYAVAAKCETQQRSSSVHFQLIFLHSNA